MSFRDDLELFRAITGKGMDTFYKWRKILGEFDPWVYLNYDTLHTYNVSSWRVSNMKRTATFANHKGKKLSEEHKRKISIAHKGKEPWNKNKKTGPHTQEWKDKMLATKRSNGTLVSADCWKKGHIPWNYNSNPQFYRRIAEKTGLDRLTVFKYTGPIVPKDWTYKPIRSAPQEEVRAFVSSIYTGEIICDKGILKRDGKRPLTLDIYMPEKKVAIEYDGLYWHCSLHTEKYYHKEKSDLCREQGIRLIHIFSDEWEEKKDICKSIIASALGIYQERIFARLCEVREVPKKEARDFFNRNHIHGSANMFRAIGLYYRDELVQCCSFRKSFTNKKDFEKCVELSRMSTKLNTQVIGGFSRLMLRSGYRYVESFVDLAKFDGSGYEGTGWYRMKDTVLDYWYTDCRQRYGRQSFMKKSCLKKWPDADPEKSEEQLCAEHELFRVYGCGNMHVYWKID